MQFLHFAVTIVNITNANSGGNVTFCEFVFYIITGDVGLNSIHIILDTFYTTKTRLLSQLFQHKRISNYVCVQSMETLA